MQLAERLADIKDAIERAQGQLHAAQRETMALKGATLRASDLRTALTSFMPIWSELFPKEQARVLNLLVERVVYDAQAGTLTIDYRSSGIRLLAAEAQEASP